ncbi:MAG: peptidyl-prolyl cis-trans isomerase [Desulfovibrio sp.]|nr:peptidyl-prolyl cis-trans isomerase [Desulfovibrio sp.]
MHHLFVILQALVVLCLSARAADAAEERNIVELRTNKGVIVIDLNFDKAPVTAANFRSYVEEGFYDGTVFHRVIPGFMIQGGGLTTKMIEKKTRAPIKNEAGNKLPNDKYTVAMARTSDPHSATAQFFINTKGNGFLNHKSPSGNNWGYCVFGKVIGGKSVVDAIEKTPTGNRGPYENVPTDPVIIEKAILRE